MYIVKLDKHSRTPFQTMQISAMGLQILESIADGDGLRHAGKENRAEWDTLYALGLIEIDFDKYEDVLTCAGEIHLAHIRSSSDGR